VLTLVGETRAVAVAKQKSVPMVVSRVIVVSFARWRTPARRTKLTIWSDTDKPFRFTPSGYEWSSITPRPV
jgi:hypothetical protein